MATRWFSHSAAQATTDIKCLASEWSTLTPISYPPNIAAIRATLGNPDKGCRN